MADILSPIIFQFHKGAIRTRIQAGQRAGVHQFQFHKGAIRTFSIMADILSPIIFQFHKGAIRTRWMISVDAFSSISIP